MSDFLDKAISRIGDSLPYPWYSYLLTFPILAEGQTIERFEVVVGMNVRGLVYTIDSVEFLRSTDKGKTWEREAVPKEHWDLFISQAENTLGDHVIVLKEEHNV